jgi:TRAP-type C4-dicarboxylate transport system permease small subunit
MTGKKEHVRAEGMPKASRWLRGLMAAERVLGVLDKAAMLVVAIALAGIMCVTIVDVIGRYGFNSPLEWAFTLISSYLLVAAFFLSVSYTFRQKGHVNVDIFHSRLPPRARNAVTAGTELLAVVFIGIIFWQGVLTTWNAWGDKLVEFGIISWPTWASKIFVPLGTGLLVARLLHSSVIHLLLVLRPGAAEAFERSNLIFREGTNA